mmetsp:Transcript_28280/g.76620  ORF Transcript_28280/g.76620 Transcript_28280/m.76620 type:complete len:103 (+) Transcript_28280:558-866(+)
MASILRLKYNQILESAFLVLRIRFYPSQSVSTCCHKNSRGFDDCNISLFNFESLEPLPVTDIGMIEGHFISNPCKSLDLTMHSKRINCGFPRGSKSACRIDI